MCMWSDGTPSLIRLSIFGCCNRASIILLIDILTATLSGVAHTFHLHWLLRRLIRWYRKILHFHSKGMLHTIAKGRLQIRAVKSNPSNRICVPERVGRADGEAIREGVECKVSVGGPGGRSEANVVYVSSAIVVGIGTEEPRGFTAVRVGLEG